MPNRNRYDFILNLSKSYRYGLLKHQDQLVREGLSCDGLFRVVVAQGETTAVYDGLQNGCLEASSTPTRRFGIEPMNENPSGRPGLRWMLYH